MTLVALGGLTVGEAAPGAELAVSAGVAGITPGLAELEARMSALGGWTPIMIDFTAQIALANDLIASLTAAIGVITPPDPTAQLAMITAAIAQLGVTVSGIQAQLAVLNGLLAPLGAAGVFGYAFDGDTDQLGPELGSELAGGVPGGGPADHANAVVFVTTVPATWTAMGEIFKVAP